MTAPVQDSLIFGMGDCPSENPSNPVESPLDRPAVSTSGCVKLEPNLSVADEFLRVLDPAGNFTFQTFDDDEMRKANHLVTIRHGILKQHRQTLKAMNQSGAGIFVTVNETDGNGRKTENVTRVRALFLDLDGAPLEPVLDASRVAEIPPHIVVESSPGRFHVYWIVKDVRLEEFESYQKALIKRFGGDPVIHDLPRVMRLPGFWHQKDPTKPYMTRILEVLDA